MNWGDLESRMLEGTEKIPDTIEFPNGVWGCQYCAGVGYEDYPSNHQPCRVVGHQERFENQMKAIRDYMRRHPEPYPIGRKCPYCKSEIECRHWDGHGWSRDR